MEMPDHERGGSPADVPRRDRAVLVTLVILASISAILAYALLSTSMTLSSERQQTANMTQIISELDEALARESDRNREYANMLDNYQKLVLNYQEAAICNLTNATAITLSLNSESVVAPAVMAVARASWPRTTYSYQGVITNLSLEIIPGRGRVLVNTAPLMGEVFQDTAILARETAEKISGRSLSNYDLIFSISAPAAIPGVDGPSAGAAMCLLALAIINHESLRTDIALTGTIQPDGTVGEIGGVLEKAQAAMEAGATTFFIPEENAEIVVYEEVEVRRWGRVGTASVPVQVLAEEYIEENVGIDVELVQNVGEILERAIIQ